MNSFNPAQRQTPISMHWVNITPSKAKAILEHTRISKLPQRNLSKAVAQKYANEMEKGTWHSNTADVIRLCVYGGDYAALDGQHRLGAIVKSGHAQDSWIALDVPPEAFKYIDQGALRTLSHVMTAAGWDKPAMLSSVARMLYDQSKGRNPINAAPTLIASGTQFDWLLQNHEGLLDMSRTYGTVINNAAKNFKIQEAVLTFMFYHWEWQDHDRAIHVITNMADDLPKFINPIYDLAFRVMNETYTTIANQKASGMAVRADKQRYLQAMSMRFAWESDSDRAGKATNINEFKKAQKAWQKSVSNQTSWAELL